MQNSYLLSFRKRALDLSLIAAALPLWLPILTVLAFFVRMFLGRPVFFRQTRAGLHGAPFRIVKFRSMNDKRNEEGELLPDAQRLTRFGCFLRNTSLDELPELLNVLKGEMSLVGPRPLLMQYLPLYSAKQARRHETKPGITGLAQVKGRNALTWEEKFAYDVDYVDNASLLLDISIILQTLAKVLKREGISPDSGVTCEYFTGSPENKDS